MADAYQVEFDLRHPTRGRRRLRANMHVGSWIQTAQHAIDDAYYHCYMPAYGPCAVLSDTGEIELRPSETELIAVRVTPMRQVDSGRYVPIEGG